MRLEGTYQAVLYATKAIMLCLRSGIQYLEGFEIPSTIAGPMPRPLAPLPGIGWCLAFPPRDRHPEDSTESNPNDLTRAP